MITLKKWLSRNRPAALREQVQKIDQGTGGQISPFTTPWDSELPPLDEVVRRISGNVVQKAGEICLGNSNVYNTLRATSGLNKWSQPWDAESVNWFRNEHLGTQPSTDVPTSLAAYHNIRQQVDGFRSRLEEELKTLILSNPSKQARYSPGLESAFYTQFRDIVEQYAQAVDCSQVDRAMQMGGTRKY